MKRVILSVLCSGALLPAFCQLYKGDFLVGGSVEFSRQSSNLGPISTISTLITMAPDAGYFILDKLAMGLRPQYTRNKFKFMDVYKSNEIGIAPFVRYYILKADRRVNLYGEASVFASRVKSKSNGVTNISKMRGYSFAAGPVFFISRQLALALSAEFTDTYNIDTKTLDNSTISSKIAFQVHL